MFKELIERQRIIFRSKVDSWEEAVKIAAQPLIRDGAIEEKYIDAMLACIKEYGPYVVIAPDIAIPHASSGLGVNETAISFLKVEEPVHFGDSPEYDARLIFVLASVGGDSHMSLIKSIVEDLSDADTVQKLLEAQTIDCIKNIFEKIRGCGRRF